MSKVSEASRRNIAVIGCGVIGLTAAIRLRQRGFPVTIIARDLPPATTSDVAAAFWFPYKALPHDRVLKWATATRTELDRSSNAESGVSTVELLIMFREPLADPWWASAVQSRPAEVSELPASFAHGYVLPVPLIETPKYMPWLLSTFKKLGGNIEQRDLKSISDIGADYGLIVNCSGLSARELCNDSSVFPIRGQIVRAQRPQLGVPSRIFLDEETPTYIVPRSSDIILGGTAGHGDWELQPREETAQNILFRCGKLAGFASSPEILEHRVGLRPGRTEVRLEKEKLADGRSVIHNYGHGGAGFTLCWGCADEVADLAESSS